VVSAVDRIIAELPLETTDLRYWFILNDIYVVETRLPDLAIIKPIGRIPAPSMKFFRGELTHAAGIPILFSRFE